jgi:molybdopterin-guanine dinucleotide biosynthesis protein A
LLERRLAAGELALHATLAALDAAEVDIDPGLLVNVNTVDELRSLG